GLFFTHQMAVLRESGTRVVIIAGNHDADNKMSRSLRWPDNVKVLASREPESYRMDDIGVVVHGQSFATATVTEDLSQSYPLPLPGMFNIGLLHTCLTGREGHEPYAPCTLAALSAKGYDYWALGHVHTREVLCEQPPVVFPGNLQGRHIRETGPKGCMLVSVDGRGSASLQFEALDVLRWALCKVDATDVTSPESLLDRFASEGLKTVKESQGRPVAMRVEFVGATPLHEKIKNDVTRWTSQVRAAAIECGGGQIWVEKVKFGTAAPARRSVPEEIQGPLAELSGLVRELRDDPASLAELSGQLADLRSKLPVELKDRRDGLALDDVQYLAGVLEEAESLLVGRLLSGGKKS
ncbi:MAG TPA: DNA repair exonuclease, partial [Candidatus Obscuribacterales bacterium]